MGMIRFSETIFNAELSTNGCEVITSLHFRIVPAKESRTTFFSQEVFICYWTMAFCLHRVDINHTTLDTIEALGTRISA